MPYLAGRTLQKADPGRFAGPIAQAERWLLEIPVDSTPNAAAVILALGARRPQALELIRRGQASDGGWGPYPHSPSEPFDTAVALLALASPPDRPANHKLIERGRAYLIRAQLPSGGWTETTRPPGSRSYAQHVSTSAWATLALLRTHDSSPQSGPSDR